MNTAAAGATAALSGMGGIVGAIGGVVISGLMRVKSETGNTVIIGSTLVGAVIGAAVGGNHVGAAYEPKQVGTGSLHLNTSRLFP